MTSPRQFDILQCDLAAGIECNSITFETARVLTLLAASLPPTDLFQNNSDLPQRLADPCPAGS